MEYYDESNLRIVIPTGFRVSSPTPIDSRMLINTKEELNYLVDNNLVYFGLRTFCKEDELEYEYTRHGWVSTDKSTQVISYFNIHDPKYDDDGNVTKKGSVSINIALDSDFYIENTEDVRFVSRKNIYINSNDVVAFSSPRIDITNGTWVDQAENGNGKPPVIFRMNGSLTLSHNATMYNLSINKLTIRKPVPIVIGPVNKTNDGHSRIEVTMDDINTIMNNADVLNITAKNVSVNQLTLRTPAKFNIGGVEKSFDGHTTLSFSHSELTTILNNSSGYNLGNKLNAKAAKHVAYANLTAAGWTGSAAPYSQTVTLSGITDENPILVSGLADGASAATQAAYTKAYIIICQGTGTFDVASQRATFKVYKKPVTDCRIGLKG